jgi:hypothetical protein
MKRKDLAKIAKSSEIHDFEIDIGSNRTIELGSLELNDLNWPNPNQQRSSWLLSDLEKLEADPILPHLFERIPIESIDKENEIMREKQRPPSIFHFYPPNHGINGMVETRMMPDSPKEHSPAKLLVKCTHLKFDLEIEPMWASMALYDLKVNYLNINYIIR